MCNVIIKENKWINGALPAIFIHVCIGSVYCWSLLKGSIAAEMGMQTSDIEFAFSLAIFFLGMSAAFMGRYIEKNVTFSSLLSALCFSFGLILSSVAVYLKSVPLLFLGFGCIMGIGLGIGYISPVKTLMLWFSKHKGIATGIAISGFGLSKVIFSPYIEWCTKAYSIHATLWTMAIMSIILMLVACFAIKKPSWWVEEKKSITVKELSNVVLTKDYIKIWLIFFLNITCGLALIAFEKDLCLTNGMTAVAIVSSLTAFFNTAGRFGYATTSDYFKHKKHIYTIIFASCALLCFTYVSNVITASVITIILLCVINLGYGGGFSTMPNLLQEKYGMKNISTIHGIMLSAWATAGLCGNNLSNLLINRLHFNYITLLFILGCLYLVSLFITLTIKNTTYMKQ